MKNKIYKDDFEGFLRENANDFLMVPSRRVWYSIYNNMHPGKKWPSMAVCLLILSAVLFIGVSNNNSLSTAARKATADNLSGIAKQYAHENTINLLAPVTAMVRAGSSRFSMNFPPVDAIDNNSFANQPEGTMNEDVLTIDEYGSAANNNFLPVLNTVNNRAAAAKYQLNFSPGETGAIDFAAAVKVVSGDMFDISFIPADVNATAKKTIAETALVVKETAENDRSWKEDYAFRNKPRVNQFRQQATIGYYITPSFGYRGFFNNRAQRNAVIASTGETKLNDGAALNLELGAALQYKITPVFRLKAGLQANYTNYISNVTALNHPTQTSLAVNNDNAFRSSEYAVKSGEARLNKITAQISLPMGADVKLAGHKKVKWYAGATLQPTYVLGGSAYVLSADGMNYISESPLLRKWNMNGSFETFLSFRPSSGVTLNVGPQVRYQFLSTYKQEYNYTEKLYNIGLKIGVSTDF